ALIRRRLTVLAGNATSMGRMQLPPCPYLPSPRSQMDWRVMASHGDDRGPAFYLTALEYGQYLWQRGLAARALLCLDRALSADLRGDEPVLRQAPLPYLAMAWFLAHVPPSVFVGNPRVHFQHYADRMNEPRRDQRRWRAWACWAITRRVRPDWPADPKHDVREPTEAEIAEALRRHGLPGECELWEATLRTLQPRPME
ncbi:MAG TPA: hypothetical protein VHF69_12845, partial [Candidatus Synoicihabitans sp.]|nr:hypothetical protein [Candidatus Synoicihabitans sp.]